MAVGGTTCGLEEEAVAFYPILVPIFLALGYDSIVCVGAIFLAATGLPGIAHLRLDATRPWPPELTVKLP